MAKRHTILTNEQLQSLLKRNFSSFHDVLPIEEGFSTAVWRFTSSGKNYFLRVSYDGRSLTPETIALKKIQPLHVKAPKVIASDSTKQDIPYPYSILSEIPGDPLSRVKDMPQKAQETILYNAGVDLAKINTIPVKGFGFCDYEKSEKEQEIIGMFHQWDDVLVAELDQRLATFQNTGIFSPEYISKISSYIIDNKKNFTIQQGYLAHGDFDTSQIFSYNDIYTGIIDFGEVRSADLVWDLSHFFMYTPEYISPLLRGWQSYMQAKSHEINLDNEALLKRISFYSVFISIDKGGWVIKNNPKADVSYYISTIRNIVLK